MKKQIALLLTLLLLISSLSPAGARNAGRQIILLTEYQQYGWGDRFQLGAVDSEGKLWTYESDSRGAIPYSYGELLDWAETTDALVQASSLTRERLTEILSLVDTVPVQELNAQSCANDAGIQTSIAVRAGRDGSREIIELGESGDSTSENTAPSAQALYRELRVLFPEITSYDGEELMSPQGFRKQSILSFCGYDGIDLTRLRMTAWKNDCEAGLSETEPEMSAEELSRLNVTGMRSSLSVTGNTVLYFFEDSTGNIVCSFEFYGHLLIRPDGMYSLSN